MRVLQIGNFQPGVTDPWSTETHLKRALEYNGHEVEAAQEDLDGLWSRLANQEWADSWDFVLWTRTGWDYTSPEHGRYESQAEALLLQYRFLSRMKKLGVPVVAYHLDLFFGLNPARVAVLDEPFGQCDLVVTADGGHQAEFEAKGINHLWFPPAVSLAECEPGMFRDEFHSPIAFVGNWTGDYHRESAHRHELVQWLQTNYARDCAFWPPRGHTRQIRGADLRDLYASVDVVVGDSCFAGQIPNYWSDRIPETLGRGGFLIHPDVPGLEKQFTIDSGNVDLTVWEAGDWEELGMQIENSLSHPDARREIARHGRQTVIEKHTYERRMEELVYLLIDRELLPMAKSETIKAAIKKAAPRKKAAK